VHVPSVTSGSQHILYCIMQYIHCTALRSTAAKYAYVRKGSVRHGVECSISISISASSSALTTRRHNYPGPMEVTSSMCECIVACLSPSPLSSHTSDDRPPSVVRHEGGGRLRHDTVCFTGGAADPGALKQTAPGAWDSIHSEVPHTPQFDSHTYIHLTLSLTFFPPPLPHTHSPPPPNTQRCVWTTALARCTLAHSRWRGTRSVATSACYILKGHVSPYFTHEHTAY
jgi:hypothetical protein